MFGGLEILPYIYSLPSLMVSCPPVASLRTKHLIRVEFDLRQTKKFQPSPEFRMRKVWFGLDCNRTLSLLMFILLRQAQLKSGTIFLLTCKCQEKSGKSKVSEFFAALADSSSRDTKDDSIPLWVHKKNSKTLQDIAPSSHLRAFCLCSVISQTRIYACCSKHVKFPLLTSMMVL